MPQVVKPQKRSRFTASPAGGRRVGGEWGKRDSPSSPCDRLGAGKAPIGVGAIGKKQRGYLRGVGESSNPLLGATSGGKITALQRKLPQHPSSSGGRSASFGGGSGALEEGIHDHGNSVVDPDASMTPALGEEQQPGDVSRKERDTMKSRIQRLEQSEEILKRTERRLKKLLQEKAELLKDVKVEVEENRTEWLQAEEKLEEAENLLQIVKAELERYRGWWLTEFYCLKVVLKLVPEGERSGVEAIAASSQARFAEYSK